MELSDAKEKSPATPGIDPGTFRLLAQCYVACSIPDFKKSCDQILFYKVYVPISCKYIITNI